MNLVDVQIKKSVSSHYCKHACIRTYVCVTNDSSIRLFRHMKSLGKQLIKLTLKQDHMTLNIK